MPRADGREAAKGEAAIAPSATASGNAASTSALPGALGRIHARRLREIYRSAGWPSQDLIEIELLAGGMLERVSCDGRESLRVTDAGVQLLAETLGVNRAARSAHEELVDRIAREMVRAGRIAWRGLSLRARVPCEPAALGPLPPFAHSHPALQLLTRDDAAASTGEAASGDPTRWCMALPDVFSIRNTTVEAYLEPIVHEVKVRRADLLGDLRNPAKRAAYLDMSSECWYVLGCDARGKPIATAEEVPPECGVLIAWPTRLEVARAAPKREMKLPFGIWMALAKATPVAGLDADTQGLLGAN